QSPADFNLKLLRAERTAREHGVVVLVQGPVLAPARFWGSAPFETRALGTPEQPRKAIVEPELEVSEDQRHYWSPYGQSEEGTTRLPFVRIFSLDTKSYAYADIDDVATYQFDVGALGRLHLPSEMLEVLTKVFQTPLSGLFGDLIKGKHGGAV